MSSTVVSSSSEPTTAPTNGATAQQPIAASGPGVTPDSSAPQAWLNATPDAPCPICGKPDWCAVSEDGIMVICRRVSVGGLHRVDKRGQDFWVHRLPVADGKAAARASQQRTTQQGLARPAQAPLETLDRAYRAVLSALALSAAHREALLGRGLSSSEITHRGYRSYAAGDSAAVLAAAVRVVPARTLARVPGFFRVEDSASGSAGGGPEFEAAEGLVVPIRDGQGRIVALKVRRDAPLHSKADSGRRGRHAAGKYVYVSSSHRRGGVGPGAPVHVPLLPLPPTPLHAPETVRVTEGELKADIAFARSGVRTVSVPGVGAWRAALPVVWELGARRVLLAFDADARRNPVVARALYALAWALHAEASVLVALEVWDEADGKGIDDLLVAGGSPTVIEGAEVLRTLEAQVPRPSATAIRLGGVDVSALRPAPIRLAQEEGGKVFGAWAMGRLRAALAKHGASALVAEGLRKGLSPEAALALLLMAQGNDRAACEAVLRAAIRRL